MVRHPPDILITTPESLYLMLTSQAREIFDGAEQVIVDEIHAVAQTKRGAHLALTLERLAEAAGTDLQRIGLSATQNPLEEVGRFLVGPQRTCTIVDTGTRKPLDLKIHVPVESMVEPEQKDVDLDPFAGQEATRKSIWPAIYPELLQRGARAPVDDHLRQQPARGRAARAAVERARGGADRPRAPRLAGARGAARRRGAAEGRRAAVPRRHVVARARHRHGRRRPRAAGRVAEVGHRRAAADRPLRPRRRRHRQGPHLPQVPRRPARVRGRREAHARGADRDDRRPAQPARRARAADRGDRRLVGGPRERRRPVHALVTRTHSFAELGRQQLENVLDMLDGRYPSEEFGELRARIVWDRVAGTIRARKGARALAITNAGTIPDRGLFSVNLPDGRRVGELDEEMVYEARPGQVFLLGASSWRIEDITRDRVVVTPAPGVPGAVPFWKGDGVGRPRELGEAIGAFSRWAVEQDPDELTDHYDLDPLAAQNLVAFLREQQDATRVVPSDRAIVVERFRDEIGDWRLCVLSPYGGRVHAAWGLALSARIRDEYGLESDAIWSDDGIIVHLPDADEPPGAELVLLDPDELEDAVVGELGGSALFGARFRENAGRALLIPRAYPGRRTPLWQQRLKSQTLLEVAQPLRPVPDRARDLPRVPARRARRPRPAGPAAQAARARAQRGRGRDADRVAVRLVAAVRLRRDLHVRGRHAERGAPRGRARARPRPAARAARPGGAARPDRPRRAGDRRGGPAAAVRAHAGGLGRRAPRRAAPGRRPHARRARPAGRARRGPRRPGSTRSAPSGARSSCASAARSAGSPARTPACTATRSAPSRPAGCPRCSSPTCRTRWSG